MTPLDAFKKAIEILKGQNKAAKVIGRSQPTLSRMLSRGKLAHPEDCQLIEKATNGRVTRYQLRPDIFGKAPRRV